MSGWGLSDDSWRDSYDAWKLRSPYDDPHGDCDHEEVDVDGIGFAECDRCGYRWLMTTAELEAHDRAQGRAQHAWDKHCRRERSRWRAVLRWVRSLFARRPPPTDDEIPF